MFVNGHTQIKHSQTVVQFLFNKQNSEISDLQSHNKKKVSIRPIEHMIHYLMYFFYLHHFNWSDRMCKLRLRQQLGMIWFFPGVWVFISLATSLDDNHFLLAPFVHYSLFGKITVFSFITRWMEEYSLDPYVPISLSQHQWGKGEPWE